MNALDRTIGAGETVVTVTAGVLGCIVGVPLYFVTLLMGSALKLAVMGWRKGWGL